MAKKYIQESSFWIPVDIEEVWPFGSTPANLAKISPDHLKVGVDYDGEPYEGLELNITFALSFIPFKINWVSKITEYQPSGDERHFVDLQTKGPFKYWNHTHTFKKGTKDFPEQNDSKVVRSMNPGTWIHDHVEYEMPFGPLGTLGHAVLVKHILSSMFTDRKRAIKAHFNV